MVMSALQAEVEGLAEAQGWTRATVLSVVLGNLGDEAGAGLLERLRAIAADENGIAPPPPAAPPAGRAELDVLLAAAQASAEGDSNDTEIAAWRELAKAALAELDRPPRAAPRPLDEPLNHAEIRARRDEQGYLTGVIGISLGELVSADREGFLDLIGERLAGSCALMDISHRIVGCDDGQVLLEVSGDPSLILDDAADC